VKLGSGKQSGQRRLSTYRLLHAQDSLPFLVMLGVPVLCIAGNHHFAYVGGPRITPVDTRTLLKREVARANRRENDLQCLAENIYFEARGEPLEGQYALPK